MIAAYATMNLREAGEDWPNRAASRYVRTPDLTWHVQVMGQGPALLLLHGTGATTHSFRDLMPALARDFTVIAPDLPGHGFTGPAQFGRVTLPRMARLVRRLLDQMQVEPVLVAGHSAGAAVLVRMVLDRMIAPKGIVSLNGAFLPFPGMAGVVFPALARLLFVNPLVPRLFAFSARDGDRITRLIEDMGSRIDARGLALYQRLFADPAHVAGALAMMANWDLDTLKREMRGLAVPLLLVAAEKDTAVPPGNAREIAAVVAGAEVVMRPGGHLIHEEEPAAMAALIRDFGRRTGVIGGT
jgi:magnesium chelatase accessory protein